MAVGLVLIGAGCGKLIQTRPADAIDLPGDYYTTPPAQVYVTPEGDNRKILTDGECLIYLSDSNTLMSPNWDEEKTTQKYGDNAYNLIRYRENAFTPRIDAHLLDSKVKFSLDNPAGFDRCVTDFYTLLSNTKGF